MVRLNFEFEFLEGGRFGVINIGMERTWKRSWIDTNRRSAINCIRKRREGVGSPLRVEKGTTTRKMPHRAFTRAGETNRMNKTAGVNEQVGPSWPGSPNFANGIVALS